MRHDAFFPSQPEIGSRMSGYTEQKPVSPFFRQHIALYYQFQPEQDSLNHFSLIPDGSTDLVFCCSHANPETFLWTSPYERSDPLYFQYGCEYFGVRLVPEQSVIDFNYPMKELLNKRTPLIDIMPKEKVLEAEKFIGMSFQDKIATFESLMTDDSLYEQNQLTIVGYSTEKIYASGGHIHLGDLVKATGYSDRYIRKKFEEAIGLSPKEFVNMVKFQKSLNTLFKEENAIADAVFENGYYDQSHFTHNFRNFVNESPKKYIDYLS